MAKKTKEYTINIDIQVFAKDETEAVHKISQVLGDNKFKYWLGDITLERKSRVKKTKELTCDDCRKCGETTCGNDTIHLRCFEPK